MKVLFLDIDGVLNSYEYDLRRDWRAEADIDETRLPLIRRIVEQTGARIVLTSARRCHLDGELRAADSEGAYLLRTFERFGLRIFGKTPDLGIGADRGAEVAAWLAKQREPVIFAVLDDAPPGDFCACGSGGMRSRLVRTDPRAGRGLEEAHAQNVIALLNGEEE